MLEILIWKSSNNAVVLQQNVDNMTEQCLHLTVKANPHRANASAKAKKIKEQSEKIKEWATKHQTVFSLSLSLSVGRP